MNNGQLVDEKNAVDVGNRTPDFGCLFFWRSNSMKTDIDKQSAARDIILNIVQCPAINLVPF